MRRRFHQSAGLHRFSYQQALSRSGDAGRWGGPCLPELPHVSRCVAQSEAADDWPDDCPHIDRSVSKGPADVRTTEHGRGNSSARKLRPRLAETPDCAAFVRGKIFLAVVSQFAALPLRTVARIAIG